MTGQTDSSIFRVTMREHCEITIIRWYSKGKKTGEKHMSRKRQKSGGATKSRI